MMYILSLFSDIDGLCPHGISAAVFFHQPTLQSRLAWVTDYDLMGV